jgi:hypothetical protein
MLNTHLESKSLVNLSRTTTDHQKKVERVSFRSLTKINLTKRLTKSGIMLKAITLKELLLTLRRRQKKLMMNDHRQKVEPAITTANVEVASQSVTMIRMKRPRPTIRQRIVREVVNKTHSQIKRVISIR